jgi:crotonobetainyl-CoA:carnitine CoA-transferase CaiB-like acyl-CoA transferase
MGISNRRFASAATFRLRWRDCPQLHHRQQTGRGKVVDSAIYEAVLNMMESVVTEYDKAGFIRERTGAILPNVAPSNVYRTRTRWC